MNDRIKEILVQSGFDPEALNRMGVMPQTIKFVELIVADCVEEISKEFSDMIAAGVVEDWERGYISGLSQVASRIQRHFGVK